MKPFQRTLAKTVLGLALAAGLHAAHAYTITDIGTPAGMYVAMHDINNVGQVAGASYTSANSGFHGYVWDRNMLRYLDQNTLGATSSGARGLNDAGWTTGYLRISGQDHAYVDSGNGNGPALINLNQSGYVSSSGYAINSHGVIAGQVQYGDGRHAFRFDTNTGQTTILRDPAKGTTTAVGINDLGQIAGTTNHGPSGGGTTVATVFEANGEIRYLGTLGGASSSAQAISANGFVVGQSITAAGQTHAFLHNGDTMQDLGTLGGTFSIARDVNTSGIVVGQAFTADNKARAFLYDGSTMIDLNTLLADGSGWTLDHALGINERGDIVGLGTLDGQSRAFILTAPIPEPAEWAMMLGGLGLIGMMARRRKALAQA